MASLARPPVVCDLKTRSPPVHKVAVAVRNKARVATPTAAQGNGCNGKTVLQPRFCTLRSFRSSDPVGGVMIIRSKAAGVYAGGNEVPTFFSALSDYIESSKKSHDFEIISGRLAMIVFAVTVTMEGLTGNSLFQKMELPGIVEVGGFCIGAVSCAAIFAWFSRARSRVDRVFTLSCNTLIDSLVDQIIDGVFYDIELID